MDTYKIRYYRKNFGFTPALEQITDVVFQTNIPFTDEHLEEFEDVAWNNLWIQNPHWKEPEGPIEGMSGWSSVLSDFKYERLGL